MTTRRTRTRARARALPAVALAAALVLAPTAALADEGDPGTDATTVPEAPVTAATTAPVDETAGGDATSPVSASTDEAQDDDVLAVAPAEAQDDDVLAVAPAEGDGLESLPGTAEADPGTEVGAVTLSVFGVAHPGQQLSVLVEGYAPGDEVTVEVSVGGDVRPDVEVTPSTTAFLFDGDGAAAFDVLVPADAPLGSVLRLEVSDESGTSEGIEVPVTAPLPVPALVAPTGAVAGVVPVSGTGAAPGGFVLVDVVPAELFGDVDDETGDGAAAGEGTDEVVTAGGADLAALAVDPDEGDAFVPDTEPVPVDPEWGGAVSIVAAAADGTFEARFVLPAGDWVAIASSIDPEVGDVSESSDFVDFSVAAATASPVPASPVAPVAGVAPAAVVPSRAGTPRAALAHTGTDSSAGLAVAAGLLAAGAAALAATRLRSRRR